ncbi:hypothetical protein DFH06DRAFT_1130319 [Mycena polygramma]|nr:hypothetical protein DFH06DRAFT_1130319 [Mycena polygramma]
MWKLGTLARPSVGSSASREVESPVGRGPMLPCFDILLGNNDLQALAHPSEYVADNPIEMSYDPVSRPLCILRDSGFLVGGPGLTEGSRQLPMVGIEVLNNEEPERSGRGDFGSHGTQQRTSQHDKLDEGRVYRNLHRISVGKEQLSMTFGTLRKSAPDKFCRFHNFFLGRV